LKQLYDMAMYWEIIPAGFNPIKLVKVKDGSKRKKAPVLLTFDQVKMLVGSGDSMMEYGGTPVNDMRPHVDAIGATLTPK
jgi:hypothetical protein